MVHQAARFTDSFAAWESWNLSEFEIRKQLLCAFKDAFSPEYRELASVVDYHIAQASHFLAEPKFLPGPTGETNELYTAGKGVALIVQGTDDMLSAKTLMAMLTTALLAGNSVMFCSDDRAIVSLINTASEKAGIPANVVLTSTYDSLHSLLMEDIKCLGFVGDSGQESQINRNLAKKNGAIVSFISETDLVLQETALDPYLCLRFITERTRTINITAIGGNASLLELGSDAH